MAPFAGVSDLFTEKIKICRATSTLSSLLWPPVFTLPLVKTILVSMKEEMRKEKDNRWSCGGGGGSQETEKLGEKSWKGGGPQLEFRAGW